MREFLLEGAPLTRKELVSRLAGMNIPTEGQAAYHLVRRAGLEGILCFGPDRENEPTYVALEKWAPRIKDAPTDEDAQAALARRYLQAFGPAGPEDMAKWSGLSLSLCRACFKLIAEELLPVETEFGRLGMLQKQADWLNEPFGDHLSVRLLPGYDPYLLGYRSRDLIVAPEYAKRVHPGGGIIRKTVLVDGWAAGTWKLSWRKERYAVTVEPFEALNDAILQALAGEVQNLGRFLSASTALSVIY